MDGWDNFFVAMAGAAVAFAGLVLVSVSINLESIVKQPALIGRSAEPLIVLFTLFVTSSIILIPDQRTPFYGIEILLIAAAFAIVIGTVLRNQRHAAADNVQRGLAPRNSFGVRIILSVITAAFLIAAGIALVLGHEKGAFLIVPAVIVGFLLAFFDAWVLLIEIDR
jgi:modulator of FtsH protease